MPYIDPERRDKVNVQIYELDEVLRELEDNPGDLNYVITSLCIRQFNRTKRYHKIASLTGVLENVKQELYRRQFSEYEDGAIEKNGDL